jgi:hypothetical protein
VILADPPWRFEPWSRDTGMDRAADNHYPTSATEEIAALGVSSIAADDCVLFLWATVPMLPDKWGAIARAIPLDASSSTGIATYSAGRIPASTVRKPRVVTRGPRRQ